VRDDRCARSSRRGTEKFLHSHLPSLRNTRDKTKEIEGNSHRIFVVFFGKSFRLSTWAFCIFCVFVVFLNSPCRETPRNVLKKCQGTKNRLAIGKMLRIGLGANSPVLVPSTICIKTILSKKIGSADSPPPRWPPFPGNHYGNVSVERGVAA
jgi:hypothetical protein